MSQVNGNMMCFSNVAHLPFLERLRAARRAGCDQLSIMPIEVSELGAQGFSPAQLQSIARDHGIRITRLDPLVRWTRTWRPVNMNEEYISRIGYSIDDYFAMADELECPFASLNATFPKDSLALPELIDSYGAICVRAAHYGMQCDLEFIPLWGVPDLKMAWDIVDGSKAPNGGIVFDSWHFVRGGSTLDTLRVIPGSAIHSVQLNDGPLTLAAGVTLEQNCYERLFPGDGEFPLVEMVRTLKRTGGLMQVGAEIFNPMLNAMSADEVGARCAQSLASILGKAQVA